jgi:hypothetical protein
LGHVEEAAGMFEEHGRMRSMEQARHHLARAESELEDAERRRGVSGR